jgi:hypothetical protein
MEAEDIEAQHTQVAVTATRLNSSACMTLTLRLQSLPTSHRHLGQQAHWV